MRPTKFLKGYRGEASEKREHSRAIPAMVNCPKGSVPIQRTQKKDLIRAQYFMEPKSSFLRPSSMENLTQHVRTANQLKNLERPLKCQFG